MDFTKIRAISKNPILEGLPDIGFEHVVGEAFPDGSGRGAFKSHANNKYAEDQGGGIAYTQAGPLSSANHNSAFESGATAGTIRSVRGNKPRVYMVA